MNILSNIIYIIGFILSKNYRNNQVYRPTELECISNIEKENKIISKYGMNPKFTEFERFVYALDLYVKSIVIPKAVKDNLVKSKSAKVPIPVYWIADTSKHSVDYVLKTLNTVDDKVFVRDKLRLSPVLPVIHREIKELERMFGVKLCYEGV